MLKKFIIPAICFIALASCQKELSFNNTTNPPTVATKDSSYLFKIYDIYFDGVVSDTLDLLTYTYDNTKRVVFLTDTSTDSNGTYLYFKTQYFYNSADTIPYKSIYYDYYPTSTYTYLDTTTSFFFYNALGQKIKDSIIDNFQDLNSGFIKDIIVCNYKYGNSKIYGFTKATLFYSGGGTIAGENVTDTATLDTKGNITNNVKYSYDATGASIRKVVSTITYDANPSPFAKLSNFKSYRIFPNGETFLFNEFYQYNNRLHTTEITTSTPNSIFDEDYTGAYKYRSNGYIQEIYATDTSTPGSYEKAVFIYKAL